MRQFIAMLKMTEEEYINAVRSSIKNETIFLRRRVDERNINNYNPLTLATWQANMDIQFIVNGHACASYILDYVTKGERGLSNTLRACSKDAVVRGLNMSQHFKNIGKVML